MYIVRVPVVLSRVFLEDALILQCGCSFGGLVLNKVIEMVCFQICIRPL
jgi:hypothetical protein